MTIDMLPDNTLLEIFHFYKDSDLLILWRWKALTQVCRRWRRVVFGSPRRLDLQLLCTSTTPNSNILDIWPPFPIIVYQPFSFPIADKNDVENLIAALESRDRISRIHIRDICGPVLETLVTVLHEPFPVLTEFELRSTDESAPVLPETFLGGSAPRLRSFLLNGIPFPSFPKFIFCFPHIVFLHLLDIPNSGYISPEDMATCLTELPHLEFLTIGFRSPPSGLLRLSPPRLTRAALPSLSNLHFSGVSEYFEDFIARIDIPHLSDLRIAFFMDLIFDIPRLSNFIDHKQGLKPFNQASLRFSGRTIEIVLEPPTWFELEIRCERPDWQLSSMTQIFSQQLPLLSHVEQLEIGKSPSSLWEPEWKWKDDMDSSQWLELFHLFVAAQRLYISEKLVSPVARALQDLTGQMATEVFPMLRTIFLEGFQPPGPVHEAINSFATARQQYHRTVAIQRWDRW